MVKKFIILLSVIALVLGAIGTYIVFERSQSVQKDLLLSRAETVSALLTANDFQSLDALKKKLQGVISVNKDIRFAYVLGKNINNEIFFIVDSEEPESPDYSPYGQVYDEASDVLKSTFITNTASYEIATDRWGTWFSALTPLVLDNSTVVVGLDIDAQSYYINVILYSSIPVGITLIVLIMLAAAYVVYSKEQETAKVKSSFITQASHDLRSPLSGIRWGAESLLKVKDVYTKEQQDTINMIYVSTIKIAAILKDLMQITVIDSHIKKQVVKSNCDIAEVIEGSIKDLTLFAKEKNITVASEVQQKSIVAFADNQDLKQVFSNLISNSIKYSKPGSVVKITATTYARYNVICIIDQGIGIPEGEQKKVMQGFYRSTNARKLTDDGTGLGLYSAKKVVELYGGSLTFKSTEDKGSTFIVTLPKTNVK